MTSIAHSRLHRPLRALTLASSLLLGAAGTTAVAPADAEAAASCPAGLDAWCSALAAAPTRPANVLVVGDSIAQGFYASTRSGRWIDRVRARLEQDYGGSGQGYVPASEGGVDGFVPAVWVDQGGYDSSHGLGARSYTIDTSTGSATATFSGDRVQLSYTASPSGGAMRISIDGAAAARIDTFDPSGVISGRTWVSPPLATGTHTLRVVADDTGTLPVYSATVEGLMIFDGDYTSGVRVWDASHLGYDSSQFAASPDLGSAVQQVQPDLVVLELGINDLTHGIPPAEFEADLAAIVSTVAANDGNRFSVAIMEMWNPTFQAPDLYSRYVAAETDLAAAAGYSVVDLSSVDAALYTADGAHANQFGEQVVADRLLRSVDPLYGASQPPLPGPATNPMELTAPGIPSAATSLSLGAVGSAGISVSWDAPADGTGPYDYYWVELVDVTAGGVGTAVGLQSTGATSAVFYPSGGQGRVYTAVVVVSDSGGSSSATSSGRYEAPMATSGPPTSPTVRSSSTPGGAPGYRLVSSEGQVLAFGAAPDHGSIEGGELTQPVVAAATSTATGGYWLIARDGGVFAFGAPFYGSLGGVALAAPVVAAAATPDGRGYWLVSRDGGVFAFGDATFYGSLGGVALAAPVVAAVATPDGGGYWLIGRDGGVFAFGDARFHGSTGGMHLARPIVAAMVDCRTGGYWLVGSDGGVFAFGAPFLGSTGGVRLVSPVTAASAEPDGHGYTLVGSDGGVFAYGTAVFSGSAVTAGPVGPIVAIDQP